MSEISGKLARIPDRTVLRKQKTVIQKITKLGVTIVMLVLAVGIVSPFLWMLSASFKIPADIFKYPIEWVPRSWNMDNYTTVWGGKYQFLLYYWNTAKITLLTVAGSLITSSLAGFAFAKLNFKGRDQLFLLYLATMIIPSQVLLVPRFIVFDHLGLVNTHLSIILPGMFTVFGTFLMRQFFITIPGELLEAAKVDGAGYWRMYWQICLPLAKPAMVALLILTFTWHWNDYENPLIFLRDKDLYTLPIGLTNFVDENGTDYTLMMAASVSALIPLIAVVAFFQKWFVEGIANTGLKG
ncbi:ABC transporter permease subunit [Paenibacillus sp. LMG 31456]|uniref:ABC transporter permease subunit n=1 Tax=Paenibacillus foliorum TaxID=2654974 RepID=A0A972GPC2_9BACL|nr:carbohydrate ABC transporter permease [Paenibacillus foliorum]NOU91728.1 ABC transporter permease subunit [Paenibacillus foliorum]